MADQDLDFEEIENPEIDEMLEKVLLFVLDEAKEKMTQGEDLTPFTALIVKDNLFLETHPGDDVEACFADARHTVEGARGASAYAFCYDGFVETDEGNIDAVIAEGGVPGEKDGIAVSYFYTVEDGKPVFEDKLVFLGETDNFMADLTEAGDEGLLDEAEEIEEIEVPEVEELEELEETDEPGTTS